MSRRSPVKYFAAGLVCALAWQATSALACAVCYGASDAPMARGMNWGIFSLLAVVAGVLGGIVTFFVYLIRRAARLAAGPGEKLDATT